MAKGKASRKFYEVEKDWFEDRGFNNKSRAREFETCYIIKYGGVTEIAEHPVFPDDAKFKISPRALNNVPLMIAALYADNDGYDIITKEEGDSYIEEAKNIIIKNNKATFEYNRKHPNLPKRKLNKVMRDDDTAVSPYWCYMDAKAKKSKKEKKKK